MRSITNCPSCQTQFFVTDEQLNKHDGKVRCGHCLHVFDAKQQIIEPDESTSNDDLTTTSDAHEAISPKNDAPAVSNEALDSISTENTNKILIGDYQPGNFDDLADKSKLNPKQAKKSRIRLWLALALVFLLIAIAQSTYFLRNEIAIYYPNSKPYLIQACKKIGCNIELPKKIEFIVIDDSDIQEDADYSGLMRLTSTLINQAGFNQAYPNIELTLTDVEDKPKLRRIFKPNEYLPEHTDIANGLAAGEEIRIKLAMTTQDVKVAGYRVFVTY